MADPVIPSVVADPVEAPVGVSSSDSAESPAAVPAPIEESAPEASAADVVPSVLDRAKALMRSKPSLQGEVTQLQGQVKQLGADLTAAQASVASLSAENAKLKAEQADLEMHVSALESESKTVAEKATSMLAETGVPAAELPCQEVEGAQGETLEQVRQQIAECSDPVERGRLAQKAKQLREG